MIRAERIPPTALVLGGIASVQFGAAFARTVFDEVGPGGAVFLRVAFAAVILCALWRPALRGRSARDWRLILAYGFVLAAMNFTYYESLARIPLGIAVTFEFVGPLGVAVAGSRNRLDLLWVALAAAGILLLSDFGTGGDLDTAGVVLALTAGCFWAAYILLVARVGRAMSGGEPLALAMAAGTIMISPVGIAQGGSELLSVSILAIGAGVAVLSSVIPYTLELEALRRMPSNVFGVLMSLEPAAASIAGFLILGQDLVAREIVAIGLVVAASAGAARGSRVPPRDA
jgi:inner membrane transporter RhtA